MTITRHTDGWFVTRVQNGDLEALGELYKKYKAQVYRTALAITRDEKTAEDILQETFLRIYTYADSFDKTRPLGPWLYRVTVNLAYSWSSQAKRWVNLFQGALESLKTFDQRHPEEIVEKRGQQQFLRQAIDALPEPQRVVIILHYLEELSVGEISYVVGIPEGTVKSRLYYARERLRKAILEREYGLASGVAYDFT
jgi:RNA polymerase sigma-70 factor (ECF subfamily)